MRQNYKKHFCRDYLPRETGVSTLGHLIFQVSSKVFQLFVLFDALNGRTNVDLLTAFFYFVSRVYPDEYIVLLHKYGKSYTPRAIPCSLKLASSLVALNIEIQAKNMEILLLRSILNLESVIQILFPRSQKDARVEKIFHEIWTLLFIH